MSSVLVWIAGGGTGGHVYPGLVVAEALVADPGRNPTTPSPHVIYVGGTGGVEEGLVTRAGLPFVGVPAGGVHGLGPWRTVRNLLKLVQGWVAAYRLGRREPPSALFVTGGYASVPVALAAWALSVPILVYLPDIEPGRAVRLIARLATRVAVTAEDSMAYFPGRTVVATGYPVRAEFHGLERQAAREALQLSLDEPVLLIFGGSRGARSINEALEGVLEEVLELAQVIHISGELDWSRVAERREALPKTSRARYRAYPYLHRMGLALAAADLAVCRAGASALGELSFFGLPAVLVPYPHYWRYQRVNADWLVSRGAAVSIADECVGRELLPMARKLIGNRSALGEMGRRMRALSRPDAAAVLAAEMQILAGGGEYGT